MKLEDEKKVRVLVFLISLVAFIALVAAGFLAPPTGDINKSVLVAAGMLMAWPMTFTLPDALRAMNEWRIHAGSVKIEASTNKEERE